MEMYPQPDKMMTNAQPTEMNRRRREDTMEDQEQMSRRRRDTIDDQEQMRLMPPDEQMNYLRENHSQIKKRRHTR